MKRMTIVCTMLLCSSSMAQCPVAPANQPSAKAKEMAIWKQNQFLKCEPNDPINDQSPCNTFASKGLQALYGITDFKSAANQHMSANQIANKIEGGGNWVLLGDVFDADNNLCAQSLANAAYPVMAVMKGGVHGHVALIIPGELQSAPSWQMLAASAASFMLVNPGEPIKAFVSKSLSSAFRPATAKQAKFYYRTKD